MWSFKTPINLLRYLIVCRVNTGKVWLPRPFSVELSSVLGEIIAGRLSTADSRVWRKALAPLKEYRGHIQEFRKQRKRIQEPLPDFHWPMDVVFLPYPEKMIYSKGEPIVWELKLFGKDADHGFFLEVILPALEEAGYRTEPDWERTFNLWGHFDVTDVYVARGTTWEPIVQEGRLNLKYTPSPTQWMEGLHPDSRFTHPYIQVHWYSGIELPRELWQPFIVGKPPSPSTESVSGEPENASPAISEGDPSDTQGSPGVPSDPAKKDDLSPRPEKVLGALAARLIQFLPRRKALQAGIENVLADEELERFYTALEQARQVSLIHNQLHKRQMIFPARWEGTQVYSRFTLPLIRYLELASILHVGQYTHFGAGTFFLE